uniref:G_PROTEIN_RECEP_F1_2 domain-containing protein n=1 Tax=Panagrellus redivivus TaxID=6233 RepID=A0A7E4ULE1_PANRE
MSRQQKSSIQIVPILTTLIVSWWLCSVFGALLAVYNIAFWRPEPIYNKYALFTFFLPAIVSLNCVHISQFFITLERIIIMKSANSLYNHKILLSLCIFVNVALSLFLGTIFVINFNPNDSDDESCQPILCMIDMNTYMISYHMANGISVVTLLASLYFLILFRKTTNTVNTTGKKSSKMQNMIKFTICVDIWLDFLPQILTIGLTLFGSPAGPYAGTIQRVLFTFCGIFVNQRFYKVFVVNEHTVSIMSVSQAATKIQSKVFQMSRNTSTMVPVKH